MNAKILIVDDSATERTVLGNMLCDYTTITASDGLEAMQQIEENPDIDLILLDLNMPNMNGFEVLTELKNNPKYNELRTIILTNFNEIDNEIKGLKLGAVDFIRKPLNIETLRIRIDIHLKLKEAQKRIENDNKRLDMMVFKKTMELIAVRDITIHALLGLLEVRNIESKNHTIRTQKIMKVLCEHLKTKEKYKNIMTNSYIDELITVAPLHDIGKVGIPDQILLKPSRLTEEEFEIMKKHVNYGVDALKSELCFNENIPNFIKTAVELVGSHHEKYDGTGYPSGLASESIPLPGRLMAIIDVYDALMSDRVYKPAYDHSFTINYIKKESGRHFDPTIVEAFLEIQDKILEVSDKYKQDSNECYKLVSK